MARKQPPKETGLQAALAEIERTFGAGSVMRLADQPPEQIRDVIPTGCASLDEALGVGGYPRGRVIEVYGAEGVGKSTLVLHAIKEAQELGPCALIDVEHALDPSYAEAIGVDTSALLFAQPNTSEAAWEIAQKLVGSGELVLLAIDSLATLLPLAELEGEAGDAHMGLKARQIGQAMRRIVPVAKENLTTILLVNQVREKIGIVFGSPIAVPGGRAPKFAATQRIEVKRGEVKKRTGQGPHAQKVLFKVVKNKAAAPYREGEALIEYGVGIV